MGRMARKTIAATNVTKAKTAYVVAPWTPVPGASNDF